MHDDIERHQALDDARRLVVQTLLLLQIIEQGRLPAAVLLRCCAQPVLDALGPIDPAVSRRPLAAPKITGIRVQAVSDHLVHGAAVARRPDGKPAGYVLELRRDGIGRDWQVHQLTRAQDRKLAVHEPGGPHRPPANFKRAIPTVEDTYRRAAERLRQAEDRAEQLRRDAAPGQRPGSPVKRSVHNARLDQANRDTARWRARAQQLASELDELRDLRAVIPEPDRLERLLGPQPRNRETRAEWRTTAAAVEYYRHRWGVTTTDALPDPSDHASTTQREHHAETTRIIDTYAALRRWPEPDRSAATGQSAPWLPSPWGDGSRTVSQRQIPGRPTTWTADHPGAATTAAGDPQARTDRAACSRTLRPSTPTTAGRTPPTP